MIPEESKEEKAAIKNDMTIDELLKPTGPQLIDTTAPEDDQ